MQNLTIWDLLLTPIYLVVLIAIARRYRDRRYPQGHPLRPYYLKGLYAKLGGAIFIGLVYAFYYGGGDTFNFFYHSHVINSALPHSFTTWLKLISRQPLESNPELYDYVRQLYWYHDPSSYTVAATGAIFGLLNGTTYMPVALLFAYISYTGIWAMYRTFTSIYPQLYHQLAIAFLFIPSTFVWGSGIFKDTLCMFGLGWMTYTVFQVFVHRDFSIKNLALLALSFKLITMVKMYIVIAFVPALALWLLNTYSSRIPGSGLRWIARIAVIAIAANAFFWATRTFAAEMAKYSLEEIAQTAQTTRGWLAYKTKLDDGSGYDLGTFDPTIGGMIRMFPQAVVVTLFRPFLWEARKIIVLLSAIEALVFLLYTIKAFRRRGLLKTLQWIGGDPNLLFFIVFALIFSLAVGISSYNFGALSRYKIPCMPFFAAFLIVLLYQKEPASANTEMHGQTNKGN